MSKRKIIIISSISIILLLFIFIGIRTTSYIANNRNIFEIGIDDNIIYTNIEKEFGIVLASFAVESKSIKWNQNLANILDLYDVDREIVNKATYRSNGVFDIRKMRAGNKYHIFKSKDTVSLAHYFVYQHTPTQFLKIHLKEEPVATIFEKDIKAIKRISEGEITS